MGEGWEEEGVDSCSWWFEGGGRQVEGPDSTTDISGGETVGREAGGRKSRKKKSAQVVCSEREGTDRSWTSTTSSLVAKLKDSRILSSTMFWTEEQSTRDGSNSSRGRVVGCPAVEGEEGKGTEEEEGKGESSFFKGRWKERGLS